MYFTDGKHRIYVTGALDCFGTFPDSWWSSEEVGYYHTYASICRGRSYIVRSGDVCEVGMNPLVELTAGDAYVREAE